MIAMVVLLAVVLFSVAYVTYGRFLARTLELDDKRLTPACEVNDGVDFVPAKWSLLLGQHFSAIAAAGPIVGPVLAGIMFGWVPALIWIVVGAIFIGGVHDMTSLVASIRHRATSVGQLVLTYMSPTSHKLFLVFVWLALVYVIVAFTDITAQTFRNVSATAGPVGSGVAVSSVLYLIVCMALGVCLVRFRMNLKLATAIFVPLLFVVIVAGPMFPQSVLTWVGGITTKQWDTIIIAYCFIASVAPMWLLLQPRGYLGGWFLYLTIFASVAGALFGGYAVQYPAFNLDGWNSVANGKPLLPILFITIACGACSGFHSIICSGTTSKQLERETDARRIGYGTMLLEGLVAVLALATVMMLAPGDPLLKTAPSNVYAEGLAKYMSDLFPVGHGLALSFALLAFSTFVYDTLDVCTRLARYVLQELFGWESAFSNYAATLRHAARAPGDPPQHERERLHGRLAHLWHQQPAPGEPHPAGGVRLAHPDGKNALYAVVPMVFMMGMTMWALTINFMPFVKAILGVAGAPELTTDLQVSGVVGIVLFVLALFLIAEAINVLLIRPNTRPPKTAIA
jgi:carbon starvation protein